MRLIQQLFGARKKQDIEREHMRQLLSQLEPLGFYDYTEPSKIQEAKDEAIQMRWPFVGETNRWFRADAEELVEGSIKDWLLEQNGALARFGVSSIEIDQEFTDRAYLVTVNRKLYHIYSYSEPQRGSRMRAGAKTLSILNDLLKSVRSQERAYGTHVDDDFCIVFITPRMRELICNCPVTNDYSRPKTVEEIL